MTKAAQLVAGVLAFAGLLGSVRLSVAGVLLQGGVPIAVGHEVIGAVVVSGVRSDQDEQVAKAGVSAIDGK